MTVQHRPVVGTFTCPVCSELATVHQYAAGAKAKAGLLYVRCGCGCDQRTGAVVQSQIRRDIEPRPGFEHLKQAAAKKTPPAAAPAAAPAPVSEREERQQPDGADDFQPPAAVDPREKLRAAAREVFKR